MPRCGRQPQASKERQTRHPEINGSAFETLRKNLCDRLTDHMQITQQSSSSSPARPAGAHSNPPPRARQEIHEKVRQLVSGLGSGAGKKALDAPLGPGTM